MPSLKYINAGFSTSTIVPSLEKLCLNELSNNLSFYCNEMNECENTMIKEFIQRSYSDLLLKMCLKAKMLPVEYYFLLNPYLTTLEFTLIGDFLCFPMIRALSLRLTAIGQNIHTLDIFNCCWVEEQMIKVLVLIPNVKTIKLINSYCDNKVLKTIGSHCPLVECIDVRFCSLVKNDGLRALCLTSQNVFLENTYVRKLALIGTQVDIDGVDFALEYFPNLEEIQHVLLTDHLINPVLISRLRNTSKGSSMCRIYKLREIELNGTAATVVDHTEVKYIADMCPHISKLKLKRVNSSDLVSALCSFKELKEIYLWGTTVATDFSLCMRNVGMSLVSIALKDISLTTSALVFVENCPVLQQLKLFSVNFSEHEETKNPHPYRLRFFKSLSLSAINFDMTHSFRGNMQSFCILISAAPNLCSVTLKYCELQYDMINCLAQSDAVSQIETLHFTSCNETLSDLMKIVCSAWNLKRLIVSHTSQYHAYEPLLKVCRKRRCEVCISNS